MRKVFMNLLVVLAMAAAVVFGLAPIIGGLFEDAREMVGAAAAALFVGAIIGAFFLKS